MQKPSQRALTRHSTMSTVCLLTTLMLQGATEHLTCPEWEEYFEEMGAACANEEEFYAVACGCWGISDVMGATYSVKGPGPIGM